MLVIESFLAALSWDFSAGALFPNLSAEVVLKCCLTGVMILLVSLCSFGVLFFRSFASSLNILCIGVSLPDSSCNFIADSRLYLSLIVAGEAILTGLIKQPSSS